jgi:hypothetical protein
MKAADAAREEEANQAKEQAALEKARQEDARLKKERERRRAAETRAERSAGTTRSTSKGTVSFVIRPWGNVFINGRSRGASPPFRSLRLDPGTYNVMITNGDLPRYVRVITVKAGENITVVHQFQ